MGLGFSSGEAQNFLQAATNKPINPKNNGGIINDRITAFKPMLSNY